MTEPYLEITFRHGVPFAAYYYLPRESSNRKSCRTQRVEPGLVVDFGESGEAIGIEITSPRLLTLSKLNEVLEQLGQPPMRETDFSPLQAA